MSTRKIGSLLVPLIVCSLQSCTTGTTPPPDIETTDRPGLSRHALSSQEQGSRTEIHTRETSRHRALAEQVAMTDPVPSRSTPSDPDAFADGMVILDAAFTDQI